MARQCITSGSSFVLSSVSLKPGDVRRRWSGWEHVLTQMVDLFTSADFFFVLRDPWAKPLRSPHENTGQVMIWDIYNWSELACGWHPHLSCYPSSVERKENDPRNGFLVLDLYFKEGHVKGQIQTMQDLHLLKWSLSWLEFISEGSSSFSFCNL